MFLFNTDPMLCPNSDFWYVKYIACWKFDFPIVCNFFFLNFTNNIKKIFFFFLKFWLVNKINVFDLSVSVEQIEAYRAGRIFKLMGPCSTALNCAFICNSKGLLTKFGVVCNATGCFCRMWGSNLSLNYCNNLFIINKNNFITSLYVSVITRTMKN